MKRKTKNYLSMVLLLGIILFVTAACSSSSSEEPAPPPATAVLSVSPSIIAFGAEAGESITVTVTAKNGDEDAPWNLVLDSDASTFLSSNMSSGRGNASLKLTTTSRNTGQRRSGTITISTPQKSATINVTQDAITIANCEAVPAQFIALTEGVATKVNCNSSCSYYFVALYDASAISSTSDDALKDDLINTTASSTKLRPDYPESANSGKVYSTTSDVITWYKNITPGKKYVIVTCPYTSTGEAGKLSRQEINVTATSSSTPAVKVSEPKIVASNGKQYYTWETTPSNCSAYYVYVCVSSQAFPSLSRNDNGILMAWNIYDKSKSVSSTPFATSFNAQNGISCREYIFPKQTSAKTWIDLEAITGTNRDKYIQITVVPVDQNGIPNGTISNSMYEINESYKVTSLVNGWSEGGSGTVIAK